MALLQANKLHNIIMHRQDEKVYTVAWRWLHWDEKISSARYRHDIVILRVGVPVTSAAVILAANLSKNLPKAALMPVNQPEGRRWDQGVRADVKHLDRVI